MVLACLRWLVLVDAVCTMAVGYINDDGSCNLHT